MLVTSALKRLFPQDLKNFGWCAKGLKPCVACERDNFSRRSPLFPSASRKLFPLPVLKESYCEHCILSLILFCEHCVKPYLKF